MRLAKLAAAATLLAVATPGMAFDPAETGASTMFYISIPLDFQMTRKDRGQWSAGMLLQGKRDYQALRIDSTMLNFLSGNEIDARLMIAGVVAAGAAVAVGSKDKRTTSSLQQQQTQQQQTQQQPAPCIKPPSDPCK